MSELGYDLAEDTIGGPLRRFPHHWTAPLEARLEHEHEHAL